MYSSIDLFAGIGGIRMGFDNAFGEKIRTVFVSEWDDYAQKTYRANFKDDFEISGDITKIKEDDIPDFDICLAGFPCQAFSMAGKRKGRAVPGSHGDAESPCEVLYSERPQRGGDPVPAGGLTGQRGCRICDAGILSQTRQPSPFLSVGLPASGGAAGKDQSVGANRQADLLRADSSAVWPHLRPQHVGQDCRLQPGGVGVNQEEKRLF